MPDDFDQILTTRLSLVKTDGIRVRDLKGFRKTHQVPTEFNGHTQAFVARIAADDINAELESRFSQLKLNLKCRRTQLSVSDAIDGTGVIASPWFDYRVTVALDSEKCSRALRTQELTGFRQTDSLNWMALSAAFGCFFDTVRFSPTAEIDLNELIDFLEEKASKEVQLEYDRHVTSCLIRLQGMPGQLRVTNDSLSLSIDRPRLCSELVKAFIAFQHHLPLIKTL